MLVSHKQKFVFVKTMKTAGTSVEAFFERHCVDDTQWECKHHRYESVSTAGIVGYRGPKQESAIYYNHMSAKEILHHVGKDTWNAYFKFTIVRNPFDKMVSAFYHFEKSRNPDKYLNEVGHDIKNFRAWVRSGKKVNDKQLYLIEGQEVMDYYIRYEHLNEGLRFVCDKVGVEFEANTLPDFKRGFRITNYALADFYDQESADIVAQHYEFEINKFGYSLV